MAPAPVGILLAAGRGSRFDASGKIDKLLAPLPDGTPVAAAAATALMAATGRVVAVVRPGSATLAGILRSRGCEVFECPDAASGMGHSLAFAVAATGEAAGGWLVALADMPHVRGSTGAALCAALARGADVAAPVYLGRRGNPVAFSAANRDALLALAGDHGARALVNTPAAVLVEVDDPGIHLDVDQPSDLG
jgi:molybdenum cofactor cytidylyltransferase